VESVDFRKVIHWSIAISILSVLSVLYRKYNPAGNIYFPKCLFLELTGYQCPGCGSQRAIHNLLNLDIVQACKENILLVISIPYILTGIAFEAIKEPKEKILKWRKNLFGQKAIFIILSIIILFWILRNR
jgi:hypothetical protein